MERIDRNGGPVRRPEPKPETVFIFDIYGAVHEVVCDRSDGTPSPRPPAAEPRLASSVIQRWLAGIAVAMLGLGLLAGSGEAMQPAAPSAVVESW